MLWPDPPPAEVHCSWIMHPFSLEVMTLVPAGWPRTVTSHSPIQKSNCRYSDASQVGCGWRCAKACIGASAPVAIRNRPMEPYHPVRTMVFLHLEIFSPYEPPRLRESTPFPPLAPPLRFSDAPDPRRAARHLTHAPGVPPSRRPGGHRDARP